MDEIGPGIYVDTFDPGINVGFVVAEGGAIAVDAPPLPSDVLAWRETILRVAGGPVRYTILTDHRLDRSLSARLLGAPLVAGRSTRSRLSEMRDQESEVLKEWAEQRGYELQIEGPPLALPEIAVEGRMTIHGSRSVVVETVAGAAPGSVWVLVPDSSVIFAGDTVVIDNHPLLDEAPDTAAWLQTLTRMRRPYFPAGRIVPGRGPVGTKVDTRPLSDYIRRARRRMRSLVSAGRGPSAVAGLVDEFLPLFPVEPAREREIQDRILRGLEHLYAESLSAVG